MLVSRPLNRRVRHLATCRPSSSSQLHLAVRHQTSSQQRSRFSTAAFTQSGPTTQAAAQPFFSFIMHRLTTLSHGLSSALTTPQQPVDTTSPSTHTVSAETPILPSYIASGDDTSLSPSNTFSSTATTTTPVLPSYTLTQLQQRVLDFPVAASSSLSLNAIVSHVFNTITGRGSTSSLYMREASSSSPTPSLSTPTIRGIMTAIHQKNEPRKMPPFRTPQFRLDYGRACIAHRDKRDRNPDVQRVLRSSGCGEDSVFVAQNALCVADGVGGWGTRGGADSAKVSRLLTHYCALKIDENRRNRVHTDPTDVVKHAIIKTQTHQIKGTATFCLVVTEGDSAYTYNIGDSGYVLIRNGQVIKRSVETTWAFNAPEQIGYPPRASSDPVEKSSVDEFDIQPNDVFILMTDGVLDNMFEEELVEIVNQGYKSPESLAKSIADEAHRFSLDKKRRSPFTVAAESYGEEYYGGKEDDIAVVVGIVKKKEAGEGGDGDDDQKSRL